MYSHTTAGLSGLFEVIPRTIVILLAILMLLAGCDEDQTVRTQSDTDGDGSSPASPKEATPDSMENGTVDNSESVYYVIGATGGSKYVISLTGNTGDPDLYVYSDTDFTEEVNCAPNNRLKIGAAPEDCTFTASGDAIFAEVTGVDPATSVYTIRASVISPGSAGNEGGIGSEVSVTPNSVRHSKVHSAPSGVSYYTSTGLSGRTVVSITGLKNNADLTLTVDDNADYSSPYACGFTAQSDEAPEDCVIGSPASTIFIRVENEQGGGAFALAVQN